MTPTSAQVQEGPQRSHWEPSFMLRRLIVLGPPLALAILEIFHPQPDQTAQGVMDVATWFLAFHMIQLALIGLVGLSVLLLADELGEARSWAVLLGLGTFLVFYSAYDALAGIGTGLAMRSARDLPPPQQDVVFAVVEDWPSVDPFVVPLVVLGTFGWVVTLGVLVVAARRGGRPRSQWILLGLAGFFLLGGHPFPFGTIAFGSLFIAALLIVPRHRRPTTASTSAAHAPAGTEGRPE